MPNVPLDTLKGSVSGQLKHTDRREWHISGRGMVKRDSLYVRTYVAKENVLTSSLLVAKGIRRMVTW